MDDGKTRRVVAMFEQGRQFTEEVVKENERLRLLVGRLQDELHGRDAEAARAHEVRLKERINVLEREVGALREEVQDGRARFAAIEVENRSFAERFEQVEHQSAGLLNLYVASQRLHSTLELGEAVARAL